MFNELKEELMETTAQETKDPLRRQPGPADPRAR